MINPTLIRSSWALAGVMGLVCACSAQGEAPAKKAPSETATATTTAQATDVAEPEVNKASAIRPEDDGLAQPAGDLSVLGDFALWEDREGGLVCHIELERARVIGGHSIVFDEDCIKRLELGGDLAAWFAADNGDIVLIDDTRKVLVRLKKHRKDEYYAVREGYVENLVMDRP